MSRARKIELPVPLGKLARTPQQSQALRRYVNAMVRRGSEDPRDEMGRTTLSELYRCIPELRPVKDREAIAKMRRWLERHEERIHEIAREEAELALRRAGVNVGENGSAVHSCSEVLAKRTDLNEGSRKPGAGCSTVKF